MFYFYFSVRYVPSGPTNWYSVPEYTNSTAISNRQRKTAMNKAQPRRFQQVIAVPRPKQPIGSRRPAVKVATSQQLRYPCLICDRSFSQQKYLNFHIRWECGRQLWCPKCNQPFNSKSYLNAHFKKCIGR